MVFRAGSIFFGIDDENHSSKQPFNDLWTILYRNTKWNEDTIKHCVWHLYSMVKMSVCHCVIGFSYIRKMSMSHCENILKMMSNFSQEKGKQKPIPASTIRRVANKVALLLQADYIANTRYSDSIIEKYTC